MNRRAFVRLLCLAAPVVMGFDALMSAVPIRKGMIFADWLGCRIIESTEPWTEI